MVGDAGIAACSAGKSTGALGCTSCATLVPGGADVRSTLAGRVGADATCETGANGSWREGEVVEAAGCTFSCVPSEIKADSGLLGAAGITGGGGGGGLNAAGATGAAGGGTITAGGATGVGAGATNETGAAGAIGLTGAETFCTGAAFTGASEITTGAAAGTAGAGTVAAV